MGHCHLPPGPLFTAIESSPAYTVELVEVMPIGPVAKRTSHGPDTFRR